MFANGPRNEVFGSFLFTQKGLLKFLFPLVMAQFASNALATTSPTT
jgi:hypothetical protein